MQSLYYWQNLFKLLICFNRLRHANYKIRHIVQRSDNSGLQKHVCVD